MIKIFELIKMDSEKIRQNYFPLYILLIVINISILLIASYGLFNLIKFLNHLSGYFIFFLFSLFILIFSWIMVVLIESRYFKLLSIDNIIFNCSKREEIYFKIINILNGFMLLLMLFFIDKLIISTFIYFLYTLGETAFQLIFGKSAKCVINKLNNLKQFNKNFLEKISHYYLGKYKYILIFIRLLITIFLISAYFIDKSLFTKYFFILPSIIIIQEIIYWTIRIRSVYLPIRSINSNR